MSGRSASMKNGVPYTCNALSTAIERPGVSGTPWPPTASRSSDKPAIRKNTNHLFWRRTPAGYTGLERIHSGLRSNDISPRGMMLRSMRIRPTGMYGYPLWAS